MRLISYVWILFFSCLNCTQTNCSSPKYTHEVNKIEPLCFRMCAPFLVTFSRNTTISENKYECRSHWNVKNVLYFSLRSVEIVGCEASKFRALVNVDQTLVMTQNSVGVAVRIQWKQRIVQCIENKMKNWAKHHIICGTTFFRCHSIYLHFI